jgi:hypothetical protein
MSRIHLLFAGWLLSASLLSPTLSHAELRPQPDTDVQAIEAMLHRPDADIDLADVKLEIDKRVEPRIDVAAVRRRLDAIVTDVLEMLPPAPTRHERFEALHAYLYRAGDWNGNRPWLRAPPRTPPARTSRPSCSRRTSSRGAATASRWRCCSRSSASGSGWT